MIKSLIHLLQLHLHIMKVLKMFIVILFVLKMLRELLELLKLFVELNLQVRSSVRLNRYNFMRLLGTKIDAQITIFVLYGVDKRLVIESPHV